MKKFFFAAIAVCGFVVVNAQTDEKVSSSTSTTAGSVDSKFDLKLEMRNVIRIHPDENIDVTGLIDSEMKMLHDQELTGNPHFTISSNRKFTVTLSTDIDNVTGTDVAANSVGNNVMPLNQFQYKIGSIAPSQLGLTSSEPWTDFSKTQTLVSDGSYGWGRQLNLKFKLKRTNFNFEGGNYTIPMTVTATQL